ncbi:hypothetical protein LUZ60_003119 [Juncus effusus]|nr:hypothetical protein LUZ60_003119 [Juncus effusus]
MALATAPILSVRAKPPLSSRCKCQSDRVLSSSSSSSSRGLIFNGESVGCPVVKRHVTDETERWLMWHNSGDSIGLATSNNGIHWKESSKEVLKPNGDWWVFDTKRVVPSDVLIMSSDKLRLESSVYWLYYTGFNEEKVENGECKSLVGLAISQDGENWARIEGSHHTGALFDVGEENDWGSSFIAGVKVVYHGRLDLRMYYHSFDVESGGNAIGIARSLDGIKWVKLKKLLERGLVGSFDEAGVRNGHVVKNERNNKYLMVYEGISNNGKISIGLAESENGLKDWRRCFNGRPVLEGEEGEWDCGGVGSPCLVKMDGADEWRLYYGGVGGDGGIKGVGMASCEDIGIGRFEKWNMGLMI